MFSFKNKLDTDLKTAVQNKYYKNYRVIIKCRNLCESIIKKINSYRGEVIRYIPSVNCISAYIPAKAVERLVEYPEVEHICFDSFAILCANSSLYLNGMHYRKSLKFSGKGIGIGLVDSGVYPHPDLLNPQNKIKKFVDIINCCRYPYDDNGHGTFMAGIMCSSGYSTDKSYIGASYDSHLYVVKAFSSVGKGFISDILYAIEALIKDAEEYNIKVLCLPFETLNNDPLTLSLFSKLFDMAQDKGMTVVVPSGNNGCREGSLRGIATIKNCITVSGIDTTKEIKPYPYSSVGSFEKFEKPDLCAACTDIISLASDKAFISEKNGIKIYPKRLENSTAVLSGTSCAAAFISAICAGLYESNQNLKQNDILSLLRISSKSTGLEKYVEGAGMIDLKEIFH